jgi:carbon monoxide dehydrogenase subunit G
MRIENEFPLTAPLDGVWAYLQDVPALVPCLPGAQLTGDDGDGTYEGAVKVSAGPVSLRFTGTVRIVESDDSAHRMVLRAAGSESRGRGTAEMDVTATLRPGSGGSGTTMLVAADLQVSGAAAQYGRGMITDVTTVLIRSFTECVAANVEAGGGGTTTAVRTAAPASGFRIALSATLMALRRVARRFFGPSTRPY